MHFRELYCSPSETNGLLRAKCKTDRFSINDGWLRLYMSRNIQTTDGRFQILPLLGLGIVIPILKIGLSAIWYQITWFRIIFPFFPKYATSNQPTPTPSAQALLLCKPNPFSSAKLPGIGSGWVSLGSECFSVCFNGLV